MRMPASRGRCRFRIFLRPRCHPGASQESQRTHAYIYAFLNFLFPFLGGLLLVHANRLAVLAQIRISASIISELFQKSMRMSIECAPPNPTKNLNPTLPYKNPHLFAH